MPDLDKQLIVISGASSGIGLAMSRRLLEEGYEVLGIARDFARASLTDHPRFRALQLDLADVERLPRALAKLTADLEQPVRALVNNAGVGRMGYLEQLSVADIKLVMNTNFLAHAIVTRAFLPLLKRQEGIADVVFTGSEAARRGAREGSIYCAGKFALRGFAQALREECGKSGVRVSLINPGAVRTPFFNDLDFEPGPDAANAIAPEDVAELLLTVLQARAGTVIDEVNLSPRSQTWQRKHKR